MISQFTKSSSYLRNCGKRSWIVYRNEFFRNVFFYSCIVTGIKALLWKLLGCDILNIIQSLFWIRRVLSTYNLILRWIRGRKAFCRKAAATHGGHRKWEEKKFVTDNNFTHFKEVKQSVTRMYISTRDLYNEKHPTRNE